MLFDRKMLSIAFMIVVYISASSMILNDPVPCNDTQHINWCSRNGTCMYIHISTDLYYCECPSGWTGERCEKVAPSTTPFVPTTTTADPGICPGHSLRCVHGICHIESYLQYVQDISAPYCECFNRWSGDDCSLLCNKTCYHGGKCSVYNVTSDGYLQRCVCTDTYLPPQCIYCKPERITQDVCDNVTLARKLQQIDDCERSCMHGTCGDLDSTTVKCSCKNGWLGRDCDIECTHRCDHGGKCVSMSEDPTYQGCNCTSRWRGEYCETPCRLESDGEYNCSPFPEDQRKIIIEQNRKYCNDTCVNGICKPARDDFECACSNPAVWLGERCNIRCPCMNKGVCMIEKNTTIRCSCPRSHQGSEFCNETAPTTTHEIITVKEPVYVPTGDTLWPILLGCLLGLVALIIAVFVVLYVLWRRRTVWVMKMKYFFQPSEESDGRTYDAFVSYCGCNADRSQSEDEKFVIFKLLPKLENDLGYSLCLHQRDFIPGEAIADNIISAVDKSRRTILVLSQRYVNSEWCKLEYNVAHQEMLKLRHRIIPIMLENPDDIPTDEPILEKILKNITYIKYPGEENEKKLEHFWKKIQYSMPKKRVLPGQVSEVDVEQGDNYIANDIEENELGVL